MKMEQGREILFAQQKEPALSPAVDYKMLVTYFFMVINRSIHFLVPGAKEKASTMKITSPALAPSTRGKETGPAKVLLWLMV